MSGARSFSLSQQLLYYLLFGHSLFSEESSVAPGKALPGGVVSHVITTNREAKALPCTSVAGSESKLKNMSVINSPGSPTSAERRGTKRTTGNDEKETNLLHVVRVSTNTRPYPRLHTQQRQSSAAELPGKRLVSYIRISMYDIRVLPRGFAAL